MRAYVLTRGDDESIELIGVVSSKKAAIEGCEKSLNNLQELTGELEWKQMDKHDGYAVRDGVTACYSMFFINQLPE